jgi:hypothetical protein
MRGWTAMMAVAGGQCVHSPGSAFANVFDESKSGTLPLWILGIQIRRDRGARLLHVISGGGKYSTVYQDCKQRLVDGPSYGGDAQHELAEETYIVSRHGAITQTQKYSVERQKIVKCECETHPIYCFYEHMSARIVRLGDLHKFMQTPC